MQIGSIVIAGDCRNSTVISGNITKDNLQTVINYILNELQPFQLLNLHFSNHGDNTISILDSREAKFIYYSEWKLPIDTLIEATKCLEFLKKRNKDILN